jgi:hypothetical protein
LGRDEDHRVPTPRGTKNMKYYLEYATPKGEILEKEFTTEKDRDNATKILKNTGFTIINKLRRTT